MCEPVIDDEVRAAARDFKAELQAIYGPKLRGVYLRPHEMVEGVRVADVVIVLEEPGRLTDELDRMGDATLGVENTHDIVIDRTITSERHWRSGSILPGRGYRREELVPA
jgi:hypothetical protein